MFFLFFFLTAAGKNVTEDQLEEMLESDDPQIFTQDVSQNLPIVCVTFF